MTHANRGTIFLEDALILQQTAYDGDQFGLADAGADEGGQVFGDVVPGLVVDRRPVLGDVLHRRQP